MVELPRRFGPTPRYPALDRISVELTRACNKGCSFCYNGSGPSGDTMWEPGEVVDFAVDCARHGVAAISLGGGEPLQFGGLFEILARLDGALFRSFTTNGLLLDGAIDDVVAARPDKVHISIHYPDREREVARVIRQVTALADRGIRSGVNLLVRASGIEAAAAARRALAGAGVGLERIMFLPMRGADTPSPQQIARVAGSPRFQSMTCLLGCAASPRFASLGWDRRVAWCSYTGSRRAIEVPTFAGLIRALDGLPLATC